jgi:hypothetical protein
MRWKRTPVVERNFQQMMAAFHNDAACPEGVVGHSSVGRYRYQEVGNDVATTWAVDKFGECMHLISQLDHACSGLGLCSPEEFGRPLGICEIVAVGAPMQTRAQTASLIAYQFGEFPPGVLEASLMTRGYFPSKVNRVHDILSGCGRTLPVASAVHRSRIPHASLMT